MRESLARMLLPYEVTAVAVRPGGDIRLPRVESGARAREVQLAVEELRQREREPVGAG